MGKNMTQRLEIEIDKLKKNILSVGAFVETALHNAIEALMKIDLAMAQRIIEDDLKLDQMEVDLEEDCLKVLALYQPVAKDLRTVVAILKINSDLERIGDLAVNIAERSRRLVKSRRVDIPFDYRKMSKLVEGMLNKSLDALVKNDVNLAKQVCVADDEIDKMHKESFRIVQVLIPKHTDDLEQIIPFLSVSRYLERIADHATNIAEDVIYLIEGEIVRHGKGTG